MNKISINGKTIQVPEGDMSIINNNIYINGKKLDTDCKLENIAIIINGDVNNLENINGPVTINGNVKGNVTANGSIKCKDVGNNIKASGSVKCGKVNGNIQATGSVRHNGFLL